MFLNNQWVKEEMKSEIKKQLETNVSGNKTYQNLRAAAKAVLRGKFTAKTPTLRNKKDPK